jgi:hypothetical protein
VASTGAGRLSGEKKIYQKFFYLWFLLETWRRRKVGTCLWIDKKKVHKKLCTHLAIVGYK